MLSFLRSFGFRSILEDNEIIEKIFRKKFFSTGLKILAIGTLFYGISWLGFFMFKSNAIWGVLAIDAVGFYWITSVFSLWYLNAILMTNANLVFINWKNLFNKSSTRLDYWNLDEIEVQRIGVRSFIGNYGTLLFMKFNGGLLYQSDKIKSPYKVARVIENYREQQVDAKNFSEESTLKNLLSQMVESHVRDHGHPGHKEDLEEKQKDDSPVPVKIKKSKKIQQKDVDFEIEKELDNQGGIEIGLE